MQDDSSSPPVLDTNPNLTAEPPNRPEPTVETSPSASESADLSGEAEAKVEIQPQSASTTTESAGTQPEPTSAQDQQQPEITTEAPVAPQPTQTLEAPSTESVSTSTSPQTEPSGNTPPADVVPPTVEPIKEENQTVQADTEPQVTSESEAVQPPTPSIPSPPSIPSLRFPFYGSYPITFDFGAQPTEEKIKKKYEEWGIVEHNGIDFGLQEGTEVLACDEGTVIQAGDNGDHGISVTVKHSWGTSIYSHLQSLGVLVNDQVKKAQVIGSSGQTGFTTGPHLHFGIQPTNPDTNNGYLGYINPTPYLTETSPLPQSPLSPQPPDLSGDFSEGRPNEETPVIPAEQPVAQPEHQPPQSPLPAEASAKEGISPQLAQTEVTEVEIQKQAVAMFDARLKENSVKGNQAKKDKRNEAIQKIFALAQEKKRITNEQVRDLLRISQSTATDYLSDLVNRGMLKTEGKGRATVYVF